MHTTSSFDRKQPPTKEPTPNQNKLSYNHLYYVAYTHAPQLYYMPLWKKQMESPEYFTFLNEPCMNETTFERGSTSMPFYTFLKPIPPIPWSILPTWPAPEEGRSPPSTVTMLHGLKLAISTRGGRTILDTDQRVKEADRILTDLQRWFPQLQASIDENEKTWAKLGYNMCTISKTGQEILDEDNAMHFTLHSLYRAGESVLKPLGSDVLSEERSRSNAELRSFNDSIRNLRGLQQECVSAMRNKDYYTSKVESIRSNENKKKTRMTDREAEKRLRNEEKLNDYTMQVNFKADKLQVELEKVLSRKQHVLECALGCYIRTQDMFFARNPMSPVLTLLSQPSPRGVQEVDSGARPRKTATFHGIAPGDHGQPPRAPSPVMRVASAGPAVLSTRSGERVVSSKKSKQMTVVVNSGGGADKAQGELIVDKAIAAVATGVSAAVADAVRGSRDGDDRDRPAAYPKPTAM